MHAYGVDWDTRLRVKVYTREQLRKEISCVYLFIAVRFKISTVNEKMFNFMKKATEKDDKEKRKREKKERKDVKKRDRSSMSAEELLRLDEVRILVFFFLFIFL